MPALGDRLWPAVNQRVDLEVRGRHLSSRVEDWYRGDLLLTAPVETIADPGERLHVTWTSTGGPCWMDAVVVEVGEHPRSVWRVRPATATTRVQRREHVRAPLTQPVVISGPTGSRRGELADLSEGGLKLTVRDEDAYVAGDAVAIRLQVVDAPMIARAEIVRVEHLPEGQLELGLRFFDLSRRDTDRIRRAVYLNKIGERTSGAT